MYGCIATIRLTQIAAHHLPAVEEARAGSGPIIARDKGAATIRNIRAVYCGKEFNLNWYHVN